MPAIQKGERILVIPATDEATDPPDEDTQPISALHCDNLLIWFGYEATVTACEVMFWTQQDDGDWYEAVSTADLEPLTPGDPAVSEVRTLYDVGGQRFYPQVTTITGGEVTIEMQGA